MARLERRYCLMKWAGLVLLLVVAAAWATSLFYHGRYAARVGSGFVLLCFAHGGFQVDLSTAWLFAADELGWHLRREPVTQSWGGEVGIPVSGGLVVRLPFLLPFLGAAGVTAYLFWRDRPIPSHCCQQCGYDLTGNVSGVCPECGMDRQPLWSLKAGRTTLHLASCFRHG